MNRSLAFRIAPAVALVGLSSLAFVSRGQEPKGSPAGEEQTKRSREIVKTLMESESAFKLWKRKTELELEILQAQIDAKKAEIKRREAEFHVSQLKPQYAILAKLDEPISMSFAHETPFEDVLKYIKTATQGANDSGIPIYVDPDGLRAANKTMTSPVQLDLEGVPLSITLRLLLKQLGLSYKVENGMLTISNEE